MGVPYTIKPVNIGRGDQFSAEFLKISPNNRMPALVDTEPKGGGTPLAIFESGAIMMYVAEKFERFWPQDIAKKYDVIQWVMWQMGNQGPKFGEQGHFFRAAQDGKNGDLAYANTRFANEVHRLYGVMELGLFNSPHLAAGESTIADMICYPWAAGWKMRKINLDEFPNVKRWMEELEARPAVQKAIRRHCRISGRRDETLGGGEGPPGETPLQPARDAHPERMVCQSVALLYRIRKTVTGRLP